MTLVIPTEGPCAGHPCDNCKICQSGRCCRNDNPDYKLPALGEWDGPIYGDLGVLADSGDKVECHCCGEWFKGLGTHVWAKHNLLADEYRSIFGLGYNHSLNSDEVRQRASEVAKWKYENNPVVAANVAAAIEKRKAATLEQKDAWRAKKHDRLESRRNIAQNLGNFRERMNVPSPAAVLDWPRVREIRKRHESGDSDRVLAKLFNVAPRTVRDIVNGKRWLDVDATS